jgi:hypothetical protein
MNSSIKWSRTAGFLYLFVIAGILFGEFFVRSNLIDWGDATVTAQNIQANEGLFRLGFVFDLVAQASFLLLVLVLYQLLKPVNKLYALVMVSCIVVSVAITTMNMLNEYAAMLLLKGADGYLSSLTDDQLHAQALFFLEMHTTGLDINYVYGSLWLLPLGYLVKNSDSGRFARILGWWLMITFFAFLINWVTRFLYPGFYRETIFWITGMIDCSEIVLCFWLLFEGIKTNKLTF